MRSFLEEQIGENNERILSVILSNEVGYVSDTEYTKCFVGFSDE